MANKLFGFTPDYTLSMSWRLLLNMIEEDSSLENAENKKGISKDSNTGGEILQGIIVNDRPINRHQIEIPAGE